MPHAARRRSAPSSTPSARPRPRSWPSWSRCPSDNPPGDCRRHAERAAELLEGQGFVVERHPVPEDQVRANGMISATNLVVRRRFGDGGPVIALNAHGDVVPPGEGWTTDPFGAEIVDGWMYGRGVAVSKSDFATYAWALQGARGSPAPSSPARSSCTSPTTRRPAAISAPAFCCARASARPDLAHQRRLLLRRRHRPQWLPASRGAGRRQVGPRRDALHRHRRARGRNARPRRPSTPGARHWPSGSRRSRASAARSSRSG